MRGMRGTRGWPPSGVEGGAVAVLARQAGYLISPLTSEMSKVPMPVA